MDASPHAAIVATLVMALALSSGCGRATGPDSGPGAGTSGPANSRSGDGVLPGAADYRIAASDPKQCDWVADEQGTIHIGGYFVGSYTGPEPVPTTIPYNVSDNVDTNSASGYTRLGPVRYSLPVPTRKVPFTYVLTVSLHPPGGDREPANNSASLSIEVPVGTPLTVPEPLPCS